MWETAKLVREFESSGRCFDPDRVSLGFPQENRSFNSQERTKTQFDAPCDARRNWRSHLDRGTDRGAVPRGAINLSGSHPSHYALRRHAHERRAGVSRKNGHKSRRAARRARAARAGAWEELCALGTALGGSAPEWRRTLNAAHGAGEPGSEESPIERSGTERNDLECSRCMRGGVVMGVDDVTGAVLGVDIMLVP